MTHCGLRQEKSKLKTGASHYFEFGAVAALSSHVIVGRVFGMSAVLYVSGHGCG